MFNQKLNKTLNLNTCTNNNPKTHLRKLKRKKTFFTLASLMLVLVLFSSFVYISTFNDVPPLVSAYDVTFPVQTEQQLRDEVTNAVSIAPNQYVIELTNDITLTDSALTIPANTNIVLISDNGGSRKLFGPNTLNTLHVAGGATLTLDGIIVTHNNGNTGRGVYVDSSATLILNSGEITENNIDTGAINDATFGGGVYNLGTFIMNGGTISKNSAYNGGGVYNIVAFEMNDGIISENKASGAGGGVGNLDTFEMNGGTFYKNNAGNGGGVINSVYAVFTLTDGQFLENQADGHGGGIYNDAYSTFTLIGGTFSKNQAVFGGGVYNLGIIEMTGATIGGTTAAEGNIATDSGGGVCNDGPFSDFRMRGGVIAHNTAESGGGVEGGAGVFNMFGGGISDNTAFYGGGVENTDGVFNMFGGGISDNTAYYGGGVFIRAFGTFNMEDGVIFGNTAHYYGGGVCNWYVTFTMSGDAVIANNTSPYNGGGVYNQGYFDLSGNAVIANNTANGHGGGVYTASSFVMSDNAVIANNTATNNGGGVYNTGTNAVFNMDGGIIGGNNGREGNSAYQGGGVYNTGGTITMTGAAAISSNKATYGGGVYNTDITYVVTSFSVAVSILDNINTSYGEGVSSRGVDALFTMFDDAVISDNFADTSGGGVYNTITFNLLGGEISDNSANSRGGGVFNTGVSAIFGMFVNTVISDNSAGIDGGGVFNVNSGVFNMFDGEILNNSAGTGGGGVCTSGEFTMYDGKIAYNTARAAAGVLNYRHFNMLGGEITDNTSTGYAGGVENNGSSALGLATFNMYTNAIIANNTSLYGGGGVYNSDNAIFNMHNSALITDNRAIGSSTTDGRGGGIFNRDNATLNMYDNTLISDNFALFGGGVFNDFNCTINMANDSAILDNTATYYGGGVYNWNPYTTTPSLISMTDKASISGNTAASYGGGIQNTDTGLIRISGEAVISNNSALYGGGIYTLSTLPNAVTINGGTIANNTARSGAGIYTNSQLTMTNGIIANNTAVVDGGGMYIGSAGFVELLTGSVYGNVAGNNGGAIGIAYANLDHLFVFDGMVFSNNRASMAYNRNPIDDALYHAQIGANVVWTVQFIQGYNNYDISYTNGTPLAFYTVVYDPGTQGTWQAKDETYLNLDAGVSTPVFGTNSGADFAIDHNAGWRFAGWQPAWSATVSSSVTYVAQWTAGTEPAFYTIRYDGNGYTGGTVPLGGSYPAGYSVLIASQGSMICEGYIFQGWAYSSDAKTPDFDAGSTTYLTLTNDVTLYAVWLKAGSSLMYTVSYLPGAYGTFESVSFVCGLGDLTPEAPVVAGQPGWSFIGWAPKPTPTVEGDATYVAQWESEATPTPSPSPTSSPTSTPTRPPTSTPSPTPTRPPTSTPSPTPTPIPTLSPSPSPTASPPGENVDEKPVWALVNLILSVVGVILAIILTLYVLLQRNKKQKNQPTPQQTKDTKRLNSANQTQKNTNNDNDDDHTEAQRKQKQRRLFWFLLSVIMGVVGIVVFLLTEDLSRPMALVDEWTIVDVIILAVQIIAMGFTFKHQKNNNADNTEEPNSSTPTSNTQ